MEIKDLELRHFVCDYCGTHFTTPRDQEPAYFIAHKTGGAGEYLDRFDLCPACEKTFSEKAQTIRNQIKTEAET